MRDKLIELMYSAMLTRENDRLMYGEARLTFEELADYLIDHGVTIQRLIPVEERLPEEDGDYLVCKAYKDFYDKTCYIRKVCSYSTCLENVDVYDFEGVHRPGWFAFDIEVGYYEHPDVTHWMPLPDPPKEEM